MKMDPVVGREQSGHRPVLVVSVQPLAQQIGMAVVCPITSKAKGLPFEVPIKAGGIDGAVLPIYVRSVDLWSREAEFIQRATSDVMEKVSARLRAMLALN
jgi:mRNA interferase MazF